MDKSGTQLLLETAERLRRVERLNTQIRIAAQFLLAAGMAHTLEGAEAMVRSALMTVEPGADTNGTGLTDNILREFQDGVRNGPLPETKVEDDPAYDRHNKRRHKKRHHKKKGQ